MAETTRTLNPLHFEDLEPHRFEDLVRQVAYGFRNWRSIEAIGRGGSDEGMDIRATEALQNDEDVADEDDDLARIIPRERGWIIQCKRERAIGPTKAAAIVASSLPQGSEAPYGFILAAACDFSKKTRDAFRAEVRQRGVEEFYLWGKGELEDMLFLPQNDHLLFAYFNISIQVRRRSLRSLTRSRLAIKRKLISVLGDIREQHYKPVLLRDPSDSRYPRVDRVPDFEKTYPWRYYTFIGHKRPDHLVFIEHLFMAYISDNKEEWDALFGCDFGMPGAPRIAGLDHLYDEHWRTSGKYRDYWEKNVPKQNQVWLNVARFIHYDRIVAVDEYGDAWHDGPHILVDYDPSSGPFEVVVRHILEQGSGYSLHEYDADNLKRISFFPEDIPSAQ